MLAEPELELEELLTLTGLLIIAFQMPVKFGFKDATVVPPLELVEITPELLLDELDEVVDVTPELLEDDEEDPPELLDELEVVEEPLELDDDELLELLLDELELDV